MARNIEESPTEAIVVAEQEPALPASATKQDEKLVNRAAKHVRDILARTVSQGLEEVGNYLLDTFYEGNAELYQSLKPSKHASLTLLEERCETLELPVSRTFLANAIGVAVMTKHLPKSSSFLKLPPSHKTELLGISTPEKAETLAAKVIEGKLTVQKLRELVRKERAKGKKNPQGRKPMPTVVRVLTSCAKLLNHRETGRLVFRKADFAELTDDQREEVKELLLLFQKRLEEIQKHLGE
ncbi:MAG: hypothetical protein HY898_03845 [Deltaproteobacteria bacterium]|nr:hypothetical protein [Deltaproteobacteria bacterium]